LRRGACAVSCQSEFTSLILKSNRLRKEGGGGHILKREGKSLGTERKGKQEKMVTMQAPKNVCYN
jgi:hypothetical protein